MGDFLSTLGSGILGILGGGVTGILGVAVQRIADYKNKQLDLQLSKQKFDHELSMKKADAEIMAAEWAARTKVAEIETTGRIDVAESEAFAASFGKEAMYSEKVKPSFGQGWMLVILDFIRGIVRPGLTVYLCVLTTMIYTQSDRILDQMQLTPAQALELQNQIVGTVLYLTVTCCTWWFGTRNRGKPPALK